MFFSFFHLRLSRTSAVIDQGKSVQSQVGHAPFGAGNRGSLRRRPGGMEGGAAAPAVSGGAGSTEVARPDRLQDGGAGLPRPEPVPAPDPPAESGAERRIPFLADSTIALRKRGVILCQKQGPSWASVLFFHHHLRWRWAFCSGTMCRRRLLPPQVLRPPVNHMGEIMPVAAAGPWENRLRRAGRGGACGPWQR